MGLNIKSLKASSTKENLNGKGEIFYEQVPKNNKEFWKINNMFIDSNNPQFNHAKNQLDYSIPCKN